MAQALANPPARAGAAGLAASAIARLDDAPSWIYQIFFRLGLAFLFGYSGWNKLSRLGQHAQAVPRHLPGAAAGA